MDEKRAERSAFGGYLWERPFRHHRIRRGHGRILLRRPRPNVDEGQHLFFGHPAGGHFGGGVFLATGQTGVVRISSDGITWSDPGAVLANDRRGIAFGNGRFVSVVSSAPQGDYSANNGSSWTASAPAPANLMVGLAYGTTSAGGGSDYLGVTSGTGHNYTADGGTWTQQLGTFGAGGTFRGVAFGGGLCVVVGDAGKVYFTTNHRTTGGWSGGASLAGSGQLEHATYGGDTFVVVGAGGAAYSSTDGAVWTAGSGVSGNLTGVAYGP